MRDLIDMMKSAGVSEEVASQRASEYLRDREDETRFEKALSALKSTFAIKTTTSASKRRSLLSME